MGVTIAKRIAITGAKLKTVTIDGSVPALDIGTGLVAIVRITSAINAPTLAGIADTTADRVVMIQNMSGAAVSVIFGSTAAPLANRLKEGSGTVNLLNTACMTFQYSALRQRWVLLAHSS
jgi:hypothetical protein